MSLTLGDNFSYQAAKPLDARLKYDTVANMKAVADATMYDGCLAYCVATDKTYQWKSTNTVDSTLGRWREFETGGGGGGSYTAGDGIDITSDVISIDPMPAEDMDEVVDELPTGGRVAVTGYVPLGTVIPVFRETAPQFFLKCDGATYNKADYPELAELLLSLTTHSQYEVSGDSTKFKVPDLRGEFIRGTGTNSHTNQGSGANVGVHQDATAIPAIAIWDNSEIGLLGPYNENSNSLNDDSNYGSSATNKYWKKVNVASTAGSSGQDMRTVRPTNTSVLYCIAYKDIYSNPMNDYSTDEKVVGTWIDGKPLYQKTFSITIPTTSSDGTLATSTTATGISIDTCVNLKFTGKYSDISMPYLPVLLQDTSSPNALRVIRATVTSNSYTSDPNKIYIFNSIVAYSGITAYVTIQYTKNNRLRKGGIE